MAWEPDHRLMKGPNGLRANHGLLDEVLQSVQATGLVAAVLPLNGILEVLKVVHGFFGVTEKLIGVTKMYNQI